MPKSVSIKLSDDTIKLINEAYEKMRPDGANDLRVRTLHVLTALLEQWSAAEEMFRDSNEDEGEPVELSSDVTEALREITDPNIGVKVTLHHGKTTPKATDGLVPWEYVLAGYSNLEFVKKVSSDYTDQGERMAATIRAVLSRIPEDQWESEQTRSIVGKALSQLASGATK